MLGAGVLRVDVGEDWRWNCQKQIEQCGPHVSN